MARRGRGVRNCRAGRRRAGPHRTAGESDARAAPEAGATASCVCVCVCACVLVCVSWVGERAGGRGGGAAPARGARRCGS